MADRNGKAMAEPALPGEHPSSSVRHAHGEIAALASRPIVSGDQLLDGRYQILRRLGQGGTGIVHEALDTRSQVTVALKTLTHVDATSIYRLKGEFRSLADVAHPNLVRLHELHTDGNRWFFTMTLVKGRPFVEHVREDASLGFEDTLTVSDAEDLPAATVRVPVIANGRNEGTFRERTLRECLRELVLGVEAIHRAGKLHRDLKPSNVLVTPSGRVVILDFGLVSDSSGAGGRTLAEEGIAGTPAYMAPEQARGEPATRASDWYAVGVMLYQSLTGELPFEGNVLEVLSRKQVEEPPAPAERASGIPEDLNSLCKELLRHEGGQRPTGAEVLARLGAPSAAARDAISRRDEAKRVFVGRQAQLDELAACLRSADQGRPVVALVTGSSGIGKTALVEHFVEQLRDEPEVVVLSGRCFEREAVPYKAFDGVIDALTRYLRRLREDEVARLVPRNVRALCRVFPVLERVHVIANTPQRASVPPDPEELRQMGFAALKELVLRITDQRRLVITVDDLQWADAGSFHLLDAVLGPPEPPRLLFVGTCHEDEVERGPMLRELLSPRGGLQSVAKQSVAQHIMNLEPLRASEVATLVQELVPETKVRDMDVIYAESHGHPFFVTELARYAESQSNEPRAIHLDDAIRERMRVLPRLARALLEVISVAARPLGRAIAAAACDAEAASIDEAFEALRLAGLARRVAGGIGADNRVSPMTTYHDRIRVIVTRALSEEDCRRWQRRLGDAVEVAERDD